MLTNSFIFAELTSTKNGGGSFTCKSCFKLDNFPHAFKDVDVKVDTGCSLSTIPVKRLGLTDRASLALKEYDIDNNVPYTRSYGIETGGLTHKEPITRREKITCKALKFKHGITSFRINDVPIPVDSIYLNYDRSANILIGMDIIKHMVFIIGKSIITGKTTLIACPDNAINDAFKQSVKEHFRIEMT